MLIDIGWNGSADFYSNSVLDIILRILYVNQSTTSVADSEQDVFLLLYTHLLENWNQAPMKPCYSVFGKLWLPDLQVIHDLNWLLM